VSELLKPVRHTVSTSSILVWGAALLVALAFIAAGASASGTAGMAVVGSSVLQMAPIAVMHVRHLQKV
jgi:hypothetical protein